MSKLDDFVSAVATNDASQHGRDFARLLNDLSQSEREYAIREFLSMLTQHSYDTLENEMDIVI